MTPTDLNRLEDYIFGILASPDEQEARKILLEGMCALVPRGVAIVPTLQKDFAASPEFCDYSGAGNGGSDFSGEELALVRFLARALSFRTNGAISPGGKASAGSAPVLSSQQKQVYELLIRGCSVKEISSSLGISESTVKYHSRNIYSLFGVDSKARLIARSREISSDN